MAIAVLLGMSISGVLRHTSEWLEVYVASGRALLDGHNLMAVRGNTYPPFCALFHVPFAAAPPLLGRLVWVGISVWAFVYFVRASWRLSGGAKLENNPHARLDEHLIFLLGLAVTVQFALNVFTHLQTDLLIAALLTAGCASIARRRHLTAAVWIGIAAAFKATPLLFAPYLLWKRKWLAAVVLVGTAVALNLLPDLVHRPPQGGVWAARWFNRYVKPMAKSDYAPGDWQNQLVNNQSIAGAVRRWFATRPLWDADRLTVVERPDLMSASAQRAIYLLFAVGIMLPVLYAGWNVRSLDAPEATRNENYAGKNLPDIPMIECGIVMLLMLLLSPNSSRAHFCIMLLPAFCAARYAIRTRNRTTGALLILSLVSSTLSIHLRVRRSFAIEQLTLWIGVVMLAAIFLLGACVAAMLGLQRRAPYGLAGTSNTESIEGGRAEEARSGVISTAAPPLL
jgi:hypothetical protein